MIRVLIGIGFAPTIAAAGDIVRFDPGIGFESQRFTQRGVLPPLKKNSGC
jgi:hypothetical protein